MNNWLERSSVRVLADLDMMPVIVAASARLDSAAMPHAEGLLFCSMADLAELSNRTATFARSVRAEFAARDYSEVREEFKSRLQQAGLLLGDLRQSCFSNLIDVARDSPR